MGLMDKAKKLAEQAQHKLDEAQQQFGQGKSQPPGGGGVRYDEHGRPLQEAPPAEPVPAPPEPADPIPPQPPEPDPPTPSGDAPSSAPDPFKPIQ